MSSENLNEHKSFVLYRGLCPQAIITNGMKAHSAFFIFSPPFKLPPLQPVIFLAFYLIIESFQRFCSDNFNQWQKESMSYGKQYLIIS